VTPFGRNTSCPLPRNWWGPARLQKSSRSGRTSSQTEQSGSLRLRRWRRRASLRGQTPFGRCPRSWTSRLLVLLVLVLLVLVLLLLVLLLRLLRVLLGLLMLLLGLMPVLLLVLLGLLLRLLLRLLLLMLLLVLLGLLMLLVLLGLLMLLVLLGSKRRKFSRKRVRSTE
jgi:hypothetical protein